MAFCRLASGLCIANMHATNDRPPRASEELRKAAASAVEWADTQPLIFGGDLNLRPRNSPVFSELAKLYSFCEPSIQVGIDHLLARGLEVVEAETAWPPEARDVGEGNLAVRLSDHSPVAGRFRTA
jgi:endonuclease/exonuclease/phosphatase (EEP) superfamily protein YafD